MGEVKLSVITATYNAAQHLPRLIDSLLAQTDQDFEWVVADGASTDGTVELLEAARPKFKKLIVDSRPDFGIYDALNRAIKQASGEYYVVIGADDFFYPDAVHNFKKACIEEYADFISARIVTDKKSPNRRRRKKEWLYGPFAYVDGHAVALAIRRSIHERWGWYSPKFPIAADQLFILSAIRGGASVRAVDFIAGHFGMYSGTSGQDVLGTLLEGYRVQVLVGHSLALQTLLLLMRIIKNWSRVRGSS